MPSTAYACELIVVLSFVSVAIFAATLLVSLFNCDRIAGIVLSSLFTDNSRTLNPAVVTLGAWISPSFTRSEQYSVVRHWTRGSFFGAVARGIKFLRIWPNHHTRSSQGITRILARRTDKLFSRQSLGFLAQ